jgi:hypothetical protein
VDLNQAFLDAGYDLELKYKDLQFKLPRANLICDGEFQFSRFPVRFHFGLAQSVFTHLPANHLQLCLARLVSSMEPDGALFATFFIVPDEHPFGAPFNHPRGVRTFDHRDPYHYRTWQIHNFCDGLPWSASVLGDWNHPRDLQMVLFRPNPVTLPVVSELQQKIHDLAEESSPNKRAAILVLGVGRSGTSSLAHLLNVLGAKLPEQVLGPGRGNPLGHWEPLRLMEINEEILASIGRSWHDPRPISSSWFRSKEADAFQERLSAEIVSSYGNAPLILIKEPRICRLVPIYLNLLDALGIEPVVILHLRHPVETIRSIHERDGGDLLTHELRWLRHLIEAENASRNCVRVWTSFDQLLDDWKMMAESISRELGITWPNEPEKVSNEMANILRPRHRHFKITEDPAPVPLGPLTIRAWQAAQHGLNGDETGARILFDEIRRPINELDRLSFPTQNYFERQLSRVKELETAEAAHLDAIVRLSGEANERANQISELQANLTKLRAELSEQINDAKQLRRQIDSIHASICWHLTWPIRWLHKQAERVRNGLSKAHLP